MSKLQAKAHSVISSWDVILGRLWNPQDCLQIPPETLSSWLLIIISVSTRVWALFQVDFLSGIRKRNVWALFKYHKHPADTFCEKNIFWLYLLIIINNIINDTKIYISIVYIRCWETNSIQTHNSSVEKYSLERLNGAVFTGDRQKYCLENTASKFVDRMSLIL